MKFKVRIRNLFGAIKASIGSIIVASLIILILIVVIKLEIVDNSLISSLFLGVCSSIVSTLLLMFIDKYHNSVRTFKEIIDLSILFMNEISIASKEYLYNDYIIYYSKYTNICTLSSKLYYKKDYRKISESLSKILKSIYECENERNIDANINEARELLGEYLK